MADGLTDPVGVPGTATIDDTDEYVRHAARTTSRTDARRYRTEMPSIAAIGTNPIRPVPVCRYRLWCDGSGGSISARAVR